MEGTGIEAMSPETRFDQHHRPKAVFVGGFGAESQNAITQLVALGVDVTTVDRQDAIAGLPQELAVDASLLVVGAGVLSDAIVLSALSNFAQALNASSMILVVTDEPLEFHSRLNAAMLGRVRLFTRGDDYSLLRDLVRKRSREERIEGFKVLLVDDCRTDAYVASKFMTEEGLKVEHLSDPSRVLEAIRRFAPDLIVSDLHMTPCTGAQMVAVIRQDREATMPIIFLSSEADAETQLRAVASGGDGFVTKPLTRGPFLAALKSILSRAADRESRMRRDPLTNVLNHNQFMATAKRMAGTGWVNSLVALDIDHFKAVNDTFGHPVGDRVLIALAELLTDGLRTTDAIGRVGGEEFAILLVGADVAQATEIVGRLREAFSELEFVGDCGTKFGCAFSAGISLLGPDVASSVAKADAALYASKRAGRNRVTVG